ncbi:hypothetical protein VPHK397_0110 [Vibrio phage K397]
MSNAFKISIINGLVSLEVIKPDLSVDVFTSQKLELDAALKSIWKFIQDGRRSPDGIDFLDGMKFRGEKTFYKAAKALLPTTLSDTIGEMNEELKTAPKTAHTTQERPITVIKNRPLGRGVRAKEVEESNFTTDKINKVIETLQGGMDTHQYRLTHAGAVMVGGHKDGKLTRRYHPKYSKTAAEHGEILFSVDSEGLDFNDPEIADHENSYVYLTPEYFYKDRFCFMYGRLSEVRGRLHYTVVVHHKEIGTFRSKKRAKKALQQAKNMIMVRGEARNISEFL